MSASIPYFVDQPEQNNLTIMRHHRDTKNTKHSVVFMRKIRSAKYCLRLLMKLQNSKTFWCFQIQKIKTCGKFIDQNAFCVANHT